MCYQYTTDLQQYFEANKLTIALFCMYVKLSQCYFTGAGLCIRSFPSESSPVHLVWKCMCRAAKPGPGSVDEQWERPLFWADQIFPVAPNEETRKEQLVELKSHP